MNIGENIFSLIPNCCFNWYPGMLAAIWARKELPELHRLEGSDCENAVELYSLANWGPNGPVFYREHKAFVDSLNNLFGYHFVATEASFDPSLMKGGKGFVSLMLSNKGAAPILIPAILKLGLMDAKGTILETVDLDKVKPSGWKPGKTITVEASARFRKHPGATRLAIGLFSEHAHEKPDILFGNMEVNNQGCLIINQ